MQTGPQDLAQIRYVNALALFEEFVRQTARHADAATLRGLEGRFAERVQIQPSYWSQIKSRSRQIGERLARQFEQQCKKSRGWMDLAHDAAAEQAAQRADAATQAAAPHDLTPQDEDERFIVGLLLTYYRRHPQRARTRLLDLLGEVLTPAGAAPPPSAGRAGAAAVSSRPASAAPAPDAADLWRSTQARVAPLKRKK
ncbi:MAG: hypothetical protein ABIN96_06110 [Rubrivivax sp.]